MKKIKWGTNIIDLIGIILLKILIDYAYVHFISIVFAYDGYRLNFNFFHYIEGWVSYLLLYIILLKNKKNILYMTLLISFLLLIPPSTTLYAFKGESSFSFYIIIMSFGLLSLLTTTKKLKIKFLKRGKLIVILLSVIMTLVVLSHYILVVGPTNINFDMSKVYNLRDEFDSVNNEGLFGYLNGWVIKVFNIFLISWAIYMQRYKLALLFISFQILLFGLSGHKTVLFVIFLLIGLYIFDKYKNYSTILIYTITSGVGLLLVYYFLTEEVMLPSILLRRAFFVPVNLNYVYLDFFSNHEHIYWSNSIFKLFINYPYDARVTHVIGAYLGHPDMGANTGIIGSGYMHMGILGIFIYIVIMSFFINIINSFNKLPRWLINSIVLMPVLSAFISSDLLTTFLTHGLLISIIVLYLYSSKSQVLKFGQYKIKL